MSFVGPVRYDRQAIFARHQGAIVAAASIFLAANDADKRVGIPFIRRLADELIASPLIWNCITSKHIDYESEREVRLVLMGQTRDLAPYVEIRLRGEETVPYIAHPSASAQAIAYLPPGVQVSDSDLEDRIKNVALSFHYGVDPESMKDEDRPRE
jgi:hypothetical protein